MSEAEKKLRVKTNDDALIEEIRKYPDYFVNQGGSDGTFAHSMFLDYFKDLMPEIIDFAEECGGKV